MFLAWEQALLFRRAKRAAPERINARASGEAARSRGRKSLQRSLINFHLYFAQTKGNTVFIRLTALGAY